MVDAFSQNFHGCVIECSTKTAKIFHFSCAQKHNAFSIKFDAPHIYAIDLILLSFFANARCRHRSHLCDIYIVFVFISKYRRTHWTWVSSDYSERQDWSNCYDRVIQYGYYFGHSFSRSKHFPTFVYWLRCYFSFTPSSGCK